MEGSIQWMEYIEDVRQERKVRNLLKDILVIVLFATLAELEHIKDDGIDKEEVVDEEKTVCDKLVTEQIFGRGAGSLKK